MKETYELKGPEPSPGSFLEVMLKDPQEAVRWAGGVAKHPELSAAGEAICAAVGMAPGAPKSWRALDSARLSFLAAGRTGPAKDWLSEGERGYEMAIEAVSRASDHGVSPAVMEWLLEALRTDAGFGRWVGSMSSKPARSILDTLLGGGGLAAPFQPLFAERLDEQDAWGAIQDATRAPRGGKMSRECALILARAALGNEEMALKAHSMAFYAGFGSLSDAAQAGVVQALSEAPAPEGRDGYAARRAKGPLRRAWEALANEDFEAGVEFARWAAQLGARGRFAPESSDAWGGGQKRRARKAQVARLEGGSMFNGLRLGDGNLATVALALQCEPALRELVKLGWALPKKRVVKRMAAEIREFARINAASGKKARWRWIGDWREGGDPPEVSSAADAMMALWEKLSLEAAARPRMGASSRRRPGL